MKFFQYLLQKMLGFFLQDKTILEIRQHQNANDITTLW